jgi:hypothetical protein
MSQSDVVGSKQCLLAGSKKKPLPGHLIRDPNQHIRLELLTGDLGLFLCLEMEEKGTFHSEKLERQATWWNVIGARSGVKDSTAHPSDIWHATS